MLYMLYEWLGTIGTIICAYILNKIDNKSTPLLIALFFLAILIATVTYFYAPISNIILGIVFVSIGLLVYGPLLYVNIETMTHLTTEYMGTAIGLLGFGGNVVGDFQQILS